MLYLKKEIGIQILPRKKVQTGSGDMTNRVKIILMKGIRNLGDPGCFFGWSFSRLHLFFTAFFCSLICSLVNADPYADLKAAKTDAEVCAAIEELAGNREFPLSESILSHLLTVPKSFLETPTKLRIPDFPVVSLMVSRGKESAELLEGSVFMSTQRTQKELEVVAYVLDKVFGELSANHYLEKRVQKSTGEEKGNWTSVLEYQKSLDRKNFVFSSKKKSTSKGQQQSENGSPPQAASPARPSLHGDKNGRDQLIESDHADPSLQIQQESKDSKLPIVLGVTGVCIFIVILVRVAKGRGNQN